MFRDLIIIIPKHNNNYFCVIATAWLTVAFTRGTINLETSVLKFDLEAMMRLINKQNFMRITTLSTLKQEHRHNGNISPNNTL